MATVNGMQVPVSWQSLGDSLDCDTDLELLAQVAILCTLVKFSRIADIYITECRTRYNFSIDSHRMTVIEADGIEMEPVTVDQLNIYPGESRNRYKLTLL